MNNELFVENNEKEHYIFSNKDMEKYDLIQTKENVEVLISKYKEAKFCYFASKKNLETINCYYEPKYNQNNIRTIDKIGDNIEKKLDSQSFMENIDEILNPLLETLTYNEKKYYTYCLLNANSEQTVADVLKLSRTGLQPIKNNCILKFGLAFQVAIRK